MNYKDTIELRVGFEVVAPEKWLFWTGPIAEGEKLRFDIEGFLTIQPLECSGKKGEICIIELETVDKRFSTKVAFWIEAGQTEDDPEVKKLIKEHLPIARKALSKKIRLHLLEKLRVGKDVELKEKADEFRANNIA